jgi:hypothetical protein
MTCKANANLYYPSTYKLLEYPPAQPGVTAQT